MIVSPIVYSKIKEVVFQIYEPERRKDVMWGKPADEYYDFYLYVDGHWELIEGIGSSKVPIVPCNLSAFVNDAGYLSGSNVAYVENSSTASKSYSEGDYLIYDSTLYKATTAINEGDAIEAGVNVVSTTLTDEIGSGGGGLSTAYEIVDAGMLYLDQTETYYEVPATVYASLKTIYDAGKVPVLTGSLFHHTTSFTLIPTYLTNSFLCFWHGTNTMQGDIRWHLSGTIYSTGGQLYPEEEQELLVSGTNIKTIDGTSLLGSGDIVIGVEEINVTSTIAGTFPNITITINDYASVYADLVDANTQGKVPVVRMHLTQGGNVYEYSGIASSYNGWQFVGTFQMQGNYVSYNVFNRPTDTVPYEIDVVRLQEQLVSGTNIKTINGNSLVGSGNVTIPTGLTVAYKVVDAGTLYLDQTNSYYEVPATVYAALKAVWDAGKVPVLKGSLNGLESNMGIFTTTVSLDESVRAFRFFAHNSNPGIRTSNFSSWGMIRTTGGRIYTTEEYEVVHVVQAGLQNPVSSGAVYESFEDIETVLDAILGSQVLNNGMERMLHTEEVAATLSPEIVHIFAGTTDTLAITLTAPTDALSHLYTMIFTTGTTPAVTIQVSDSTAIIYPDDYAIEAGTTYEISVLYANGKYYLRYVTYQEA